MSNAITGAGRNRAEAITEPASTASTAPPPLTGFAAGATGAALLAASVWGLHVLSPPGGGAVSVGSVVVLLAAFTALGKGITLLQRALAPITAAAAAPLAAVPPLVRALAAIVMGAVGIWWAMCGHAATWWAHTTGTGTGWTLISALVQVAITAAAGALLFGGAKSLVALLQSISGAHRHGASESERRDRWASWWSSRPGLGLILLAGAAAIVALSGYVAPRVSGWLLGDDPTAAVGAIVALLIAGLVANTWWWGALSGWWVWAHRPHTPGGGATPMGRMHAGTAVVALLWFSATAFGLAVPDSYTGPGAMPRAHADCPPDCGGGSSGGSGSSGPAFPMQPPDMPNPPGGYNDGYYPGPDQGNGISIYNPGQQSAGSQGGYSQYPQQGQPGPPANGVQPPDYDAPLPSSAPVPQQAPAAPQQAAPAPQQPAPPQAPQQPVQQAPAQQDPAQPEPQPSVEQPQGQQQPQNPVNQPSTQQVQQQPPQNQQPTAPKKEPDDTPVDPTDLAAAATRRGSQQGGQQGAQQGTQQATKAGDSARIVKQDSEFGEDASADPFHHHEATVMHPGGTPEDGVDPETGAHVLPGEGEDGASGIPSAGKSQGARSAGETPAGTQPGWNAKVTNNGKGMMYQKPGSMRDSNSVRVMDPGADPRYPDGYVVFKNQFNQPIDLDGKPTGPETTHIPRNPDGSYPIPKGWG